jgi:hypothetical protein
MLEANGDLWKLAVEHGVDAVVITTNGFRKSDGSCVMGRGCALEAKTRWPELPARLGEYLRQYGNRCFRFRLDGFAPDLVTMPVKPERGPDGKPGFSAKAELPLILESARQLVEMAEKFGWTQILIPRPGCGYGALSWDEVGPALGLLLDDRFTAVSF